MFLPFVNYKNIRYKTANEISYKMGVSKGSERVGSLNHQNFYSFFNFY